MRSIFFSPMLAASVPEGADLNSLPYPLFASFKLDGVRATKQGALLSRNQEPIPNKHTQQVFKKLPDGFDGELGVGDPTAPDFFRKTMSAVMTASGKPDVTYYIFGKYDCSYTFEQRQRLIQDWFRMYRGSVANIRIVEQVLVRNKFELLAFEKRALELGYEGVMLAKPDGIYKQGGDHPRSTYREFYLVKLKRFLDGEATILSVDELMINENEKLAGKMRKRTLKENLMHGNMLGALTVCDLVTGAEFNVGSGFDNVTRTKLWKAWKRDPVSLIGKIIKYKYFPTGSKDKPRFPTFIGFRDRRDMSI
jgi:DNA ligase 1